MIYRITRVSPEGWRSFKDFDTEEDAILWLNKASVKEDMEFGYTFSISKEKENP